MLIRSWTKGLHNAGSGILAETTRNYELVSTFEILEWFYRITHSLVYLEFQHGVECAYILKKLCANLHKRGHGVARKVGQEAGGKLDLYRSRAHLPANVAHRRA